MTDAGLKELAGLRLRKLKIPYAAQTDLGLKSYLAVVENVTHLDLLHYSGWKVTDAGLKVLVGLESLQSLCLPSSVTDAGLKELARLKSLQSLDISGTQVTDAGLKELAGLKLRHLEIPDSAKTDLGLKNCLAVVENATHLDLGRFSSWETDARWAEGTGGA